MKDGIYKQLPIGEYHANRTHESSSTLKQFKVSPRHYELYVSEMSEEKDRVSHFDFGNAMELALIDEASFNKDVYIVDSETICSAIGGARPKATKQFKEWYTTEMELAGGKYVIEKTGAESLETIKLIRKRCMEDPLIKALIDNIDYQASCLWTDKDTGVKLKTRPDVVNRNKNVVIDIKTCADGSPHAFSRDVAKFKYPLQAVLQIEGVLKTNMLDSVDLYYYLALEKEAPYNVQLYRLDEEDIEKARLQLKALLVDFARHKAGESRPGYNYNSMNKHGILSLDIPVYYWNN